jgi:hypothetical protein
MKNKKEKEFDSVKFMRQMRDKITKDLENLSPQQIIEYFKIKKNSERVLPSR